MNANFLYIYQVKGLSREDLETRTDMVLALPERIEAIPDRTINAAKQTGGWTTSGIHNNIKFDSSGALFFYAHFLGL